MKADLGFAIVTNQEMFCMNPCHLGRKHPLLRTTTMNIKNALLAADRSADTSMKRFSFKEVSH
jgi:hypothetical protein